MKTIIAIIALLMPMSSMAAPPSYSKVQMYVEEGDGIIALTTRCLADAVNECNCAIAGPGVVPSIDDAFMCWVIEGNKIIFTSDKYRFEKPVDEIKTRTINLPPSDAPEPYVPAPSDPDRHS
jgi:hypothetical protein